MEPKTDCSGVSDPRDGDQFGPGKAQFDVRSKSMFPRPQSGPDSDPIGRITIPRPAPPSLAWQATLAPTARLPWRRDFRKRRSLSGVFAPSLVGFAA